MKFAKRVDLKQRVYEVTDVVTNLVVVSISQCTRMLNHHILHLKNYVVQPKYVQFLFPSYLSKAEGKMIGKRKCVLLMRSLSLNTADWLS